MAETSIEWTDATWNPVAGCTIISAGCSNCYAMRMASRLEHMGVEKYRGLTRKSGGRSVWVGRVRCDESALGIPFGWKRPRQVFVNSMSDLFHEDVPDEFIRKVWRVMEANPRHTFQILTKRPHRLAEVTGTVPKLPNVWIGTSVEGRETVHRINLLRAASAAVRFVSFEPLISSTGKVDLSGIHWAIVGGESGPRARPLSEKWVEEIELQCRTFGAAFFFKQWGGVNKAKAGRTYRGRVWDEMPDLRI